MEPARENSDENREATLTRDDAEQIRRDLAAHGTAFVMDGRRVDPDAVTVAEGYWRVRVPGSMGEAHLTTHADEHTLCGYYRRPYGGWPQVYGPIDGEAARMDEAHCLTCRRQIPRIGSDA